MPLNCHRGIDHERVSGRGHGRDPPPLGPAARGRYWSGAQSGAPHASARWWRPELAAWLFPGKPGADGGGFRDPARPRLWLRPALRPDGGAPRGPTTLARSEADPTVAGTR